MIDIIPEKLTEAIKEWIEAKNGLNVEIINVREVTTMADYFVIASGSSERQVKSIAEHVEFETEALQIFPKGIEGLREGRWILMDFREVVVHIFHEEERELYRLDDLWKKRSE